MPASLMPVVRYTAERLGASPALSDAARFERSLIGSLTAPHGPYE